MSQLVAKCIGPGDKASDPLDKQGGFLGRDTVGVLKIQTKYYDRTRSDIRKTNICMFLVFRHLSVPMQCRFTCIHKVVSYNNQLTHRNRYYQ